MSKLNNFGAKLMLVGIMAAPTLAKDKAALPKELPFKLAELEDKKPLIELKNDALSVAKGLVHPISAQTDAGNKSSLSFRVPGYIKEITAKPGDIIKKGAILAEIDAVEYGAQLELAKLDKNSAQIQEDMARKEYEREKQLKLDNASTASQFEQIEFKFKQAQNSTRQADLKLKMAQRNFDNTKLRAPYDCKVAKQHTKGIAERVGAETLVFDVYGVDSLEVHVNAPEALIGRLSVGSKVLIVVPSAQIRKEAEVTMVEPMVSQLTRTMKAVVTLKNADNKLVPGLFAEVLIN